MVLVWTNHRYLIHLVSEERRVLVSSKALLFQVLISGVMMEVVKLDSDSFTYDCDFDISSHTVSSGYDGSMEQGFEDFRYSSLLHVLSL
jgi:hypothetical protein